MPNYNSTSTEVVATEAPTNATSTAATTASSESGQHQQLVQHQLLLLQQPKQMKQLHSKETATVTTPTTEVVTNASTSASNDTVTVLHTNDVHGRMVEDDRNAVIGDALLSGIVNDSRSKEQLLSLALGTHSKVFRFQTVLRVKTWQAS